VKYSSFTPETLNAFLQQHTMENNTFELLEGLCYWLRQCEPQQVLPALRLLKNNLKENKRLTRELSAMLCGWLCSMRLYPLFISSGILAREGFGREMKNRLYERINPSFKDVNDLRDVFYLLFSDKNDARWINAVPLKEWCGLIRLLRRHATDSDKQRVHQHFQAEGLFAIEMLSIWIAAEDMEPELMRMEPTLLNADSPFVALHREVVDWLQARRAQHAFDDSHLQVMIEQCRELIDRLQKRGTVVGTSFNVTYLLERLEQTLERLEKLMAIFASNRYLPRRILLLAGTIAGASAEQHSISRLWKQSNKLVARSITQNAGDHGEHYITRNRKEYFAMFYSAAGGGILIALMALLKI